MEVVETLSKVYLKVSYSKNEANAKINAIFRKHKILLFDICVSQNLDEELDGASLSTINIH